MPRFSRWSVATAAVLGLAVQGVADDFVWIAERFGAYPDPTVWQGPTASVPGAADRAIFAPTDATVVQFVPSSPMDPISVGRWDFRRGATTLEFESGYPSFHVLGDDVVTAAVTVGSLTGLAASVDVIASDRSPVERWLSIDGMALATRSGSSAALSAQGASIHWDVEGACHIGAVGTGAMLVDADDTLVADALSLALGADSTGTLDINGGTVTCNGLTLAAVAGDAAISVSDGGTFSTSTLTVATEPGGVGRLDVDGVGSSALISGECQIGLLGDGAMTISDGARCTVQGTTVLGQGATEDGMPALGAIVVTDPGSIVELHGDLIAGGAGRADLRISANAELSVAGAIFNWWEHSCRLTVELGFPSSVPPLQCDRAIDAMELVVTVPDGASYALGDFWVLAWASESIAEPSVVQLPAATEALRPFLRIEPSRWALVMTTATDVTGNLVTDFDDLLALLDAWGPCSEPWCAADLTGDSQVDSHDLIVLLGGWS